MRTPRWYRSYKRGPLRGSRSVLVSSWRSRSSEKTAALIEQQDTVMMGPPDVLALASADDDDEWRIGVIEGLDLRGRPPRLAIGRGDDGSLRYAPVLHYWRVERGDACSPVGSADGEALSAENVAVASEEATDAPT